MTNISVINKVKTKDVFQRFQMHRSATISEALLCNCFYRGESVPDKASHFCETDAD